MHDPLTTPGWYTDPTESSFERWWSGREWTADTRRGSYVPLATIPFDDLGPRVETDATKQQSWIALSPLWVAIPGSFQFAFSIASAAAGIVLDCMFATAGLILVILAFADERELKARNLPSISPLWIFLGPLVYIVMRYRATRGVPGASKLATALVSIQYGIAAAGALLYFGVVLGIVAYNESTQ